ncbi:MAG: sugar-binding protein [Granulosicoccus sp.]
MRWYHDRARLGALIYAPLLGVLLALGACSELGTTESPPTNDASTTPEPIGNGNVLQLPAGFAGLRSIITDNLYAVLTIDDDPPVRFQAGEPLTTTLRVNRGDTITGTLEWFETHGGTELRLATYRILETVNGPLDLVIDNLLYTTEGVGLDNDNDSFSNLRERQAGSDPLNPNETPSSTPDVRIGSISDILAPDIDGRYDAIYSTGAQFNDVNGEALRIDNLMIDRGSLRPNGASEFRWFAMHDSTFLYLFVLGETDATATPVRDSIEFFQDDSIEIFIDADNSKGSIYDGIDDRHIIIPLLTSPEDQGENTTSITAGANSASLPPINFATCLCDTQQTWEIRLPLESLGIMVDTPFGIEVQLNEDNDGGDRDAKWGWSHPARISVDIDNTFRIPSFMGTAVLN